MTQRPPGEEPSFSSSLSHPDFSLGSFASGISTPHRSNLNVTAGYLRPPRLSGRAGSSSTLVPGSASQLGKASVTGKDVEEYAGLLHDDEVGVVTAEEAAMGDSIGPGSVLDTPGPKPKGVRTRSGTVTAAAAPSKVSKLTLRDQEKKNFSIKLRVHFLEDQLARMAPDQMDAALKQNINLKIEVQQRGMEIKKLKKLVLSLEHELERVQRGAAASAGASEREKELEQRLEEKERELRDLRATEGGAGRDGDDRTAGGGGAECRARGRAGQHRPLKNIVQQRGSDKAEELENENYELREKLRAQDDLVSQLQDDRDDLQDALTELQLRLEELESRRHASRSSAPTRARRFSMSRRRTRSWRMRAGGGSWYERVVDVVENEVFILRPPPLLTPTRSRTSGRGVSSRRRELAIRGDGEATVNGTGGPKRRTWSLRDVEWDGGRSQGVGVGSAGMPKQVGSRRTATYASARRVEEGAAEGVRRRYVEMARLWWVSSRREQKHNGTGRGSATTARVRRRLGAHSAPRLEQRRQGMRHDLSMGMPAWGQIRPTTVARMWSSAHQTGCERGGRVARVGTGVGWVGTSGQGHEGSHPFGSPLMRCLAQARARRQYHPSSVPSVTLLNMESVITSVPSLRSRSADHVTFALRSYIKRCTPVLRRVGRRTNFCCVFVVQLTRYYLTTTRRRTYSSLGYIHFQGASKVNLNSLLRHPQSRNISSAPYARTSHNHIKSPDSVSYITFHVGTRAKIYFANTRKSIHHRSRPYLRPPVLLLTGSISPATSSSSRARQNSYATIQSPRRARRIEFQTYFVMSVMAKRTEILRHSEGRMWSHSFVPRRPPCRNDFHSHVDLDSWISEGSGITGCNDEFGNIPHRTGHSHLTDVHAEAQYSTGASSRPLATHDKFDGDSCARSELGPRSLSSSATQSSTSRRIYFRQAFVTDSFLLRPRPPFPGRHQNLISVGMPHARYGDAETEPLSGPRMKIWQAGAPTRPIMVRGRHLVEQKDGQQGLDTPNDVPI
ncbi:hypothetical protein DFP72DRAFT_1040299 [Ephemerocybe angulata]|uniref:Centrosomin N-terminal motif 1 domain-containing protein n=1 Tax=Ephemerocybe angulata TaxID=980116 RepID=A0A8H6IHK7_9AGAR|nr:hypothetical protein DFP72DRAFT_1040299 [Tulosesus angulatus]